MMPLIVKRQKPNENEEKITGRSSFFLLAGLFHQISPQKAPLFDFAPKKGLPKKAL
jgi:hypothetical protein